MLLILSLTITITVAVTLSVRREMLRNEVEERGKRMKHINVYTLVNVASKLKRKMNGRLTTQQCIDKSADYLATIPNVTENGRQESRFTNDDFTGD